MFNFHPCTGFHLACIKAKLPGDFTVVALKLRLTQYNFLSKVAEKKCLSRRGNYPPSAF